MDPISHALMGGLAAKTVKAKPRRFWIMMGLGLIPDLDMIFNSMGDWAYVLHHRGISHSFVGLALLALFCAWILGRWDKGPFNQRAFHYSLPLLLHGLGDYLTSYGIPLLAPFSFKSYSADLLVSWTILPALVMAVGLLFLALKKKQGWRHTRLIWGVLGIYLVLTFSGKVYAHAFLEDPEGVTTILPKVANPFVWRAVQADQTTRSYRSYEINILKGELKVLGDYAMPNGDFPVQASRNSKKVKQFLKNNRWPLVRFKKEDQHWNVEWGTLMFSVKGAVRSKVHVQVGLKGQILSEKNLIRFWTPE